MTYAGEKKFDINDNELSGGKNKDTKRGTSGYNEVDSEKTKRRMEKRAIEKIQTALGAIPFFLFVLSF